MQVVGVDFGTTNVRISTWDSEQDLPPKPEFVGRIGDERTTTMPAVVALQRQESGEISIIVGEEADILQDEHNKTLVIRNIKRNALSSDAYVDWHLKARNFQEEYAQWPPIWWNPVKSCIQVWGEEFPVWDLIGNILAKAFQRSGVSGELEWRAGCPVHADLTYREGLARVLYQVTGEGNGKIDWIFEEPILFLTLARRLGELKTGSYLVYDLGGGSFDCALVEVKEDEMLVYGADGHPLLGGSDLDDGLRKKLGYRGQENLLRQAKERLNRENPSEVLGDGTTVTLEHIETVLQERRFAQKSISTTRDAYVGAKVLWKRGGNAPPIGEVAEQNNETGSIRFIWQLKWDDINRDIDKIILFGGPTKSPYFQRELSKWFEKERIVTATGLLPTLTGTPDLELVGISMGACYAYEDSFAPLYLNRLPARITLENLQTGEQVEYLPFHHLDDYYRVGAENSRRMSKPFEPCFSQPLLQDKNTPQEYELTVTSLEGVVWEQHTIQGYLERTSRLPATRLRIVVDRYGRVGIEKHSSGPGLKWTKVDVIVETPPWHTALQREAAEMEQVIENIKDAAFPGVYTSLSRSEGYSEGVDGPYRNGRRG